MNNKKYETELMTYLAEYVTAHKQHRIKEVLSNRTRYLTVVLEDIFKAHNASAVLRTAECLGLQDIHITEDRNPYEVNPYVTRGSAKWLTLHRYNDLSTHNIDACIKGLKQNGYQILATSPHEYAQDYQELVIDQKTAIVFGAEETGISDYVKENVDGFISIPMYGFTESFNISVSAAILFEYYMKQIKKGLNWKLSQQEQFDLTLSWYKTIVPNVDFHIRKFDKEFEA